MPLACVGHVLIKSAHAVYKACCRGQCIMFSCALHELFMHGVMRRHWLQYDKVFATHPAVHVVMSCRVLGSCPAPTTSTLAYVSSSTALYEHGHTKAGACAPAASIPQQRRRGALKNAKSHIGKTPKK